MTDARSTDRRRTAPCWSSTSRRSSSGRSTAATGSLANAVRLVRAAGLLDIPVFATEQYPQGARPDRRPSWPS